MDQGDNIMPAFFVRLDARFSIVAAERDFLATVNFNR
jgi:hypothetical protein